MYTRAAAPRTCVRASRGSLFRSGVGIPRVSVVLAPRCSFVTLRAVTMFPAPLATSAVVPVAADDAPFFFFFTPQQCSKQTAAANTISTLSQWSCHGSHCSYLCSGFSEVPVVDTEFRYSLRLSRLKSHTHRFNFETDNNNKLACIVWETGRTLVHAKEKHACTWRRLRLGCKQYVKCLPPRYYVNFGWLQVALPSVLETTQSRTVCNTDKFSFST